MNLVRHGLHIRQVGKTFPVSLNWDTIKLLFHNRLLRFKQSFALKKRAFVISYMIYDTHLVWLPSAAAGLSPDGGYSQSANALDHEMLLQTAQVPDCNMTCYKS